MADDLSWVPPGVDTGTASIARVYDYWLGGTHNFQADRDAARATVALVPNWRAVIQGNRDFLVRAVRFLAGSGIRQFIDIGSGIPTQGNVHEVAQAAAPGARVVYADTDPVAVAHSRAILSGSPDADVIQADLRAPHQILGSPQLRRLIDLSQPVGLLLVAVLHFIPDGEDPWGLVATLRDSLAAGSYLVVSHGTSEYQPAVASAGQKMYSRNVAAGATARPRDQIERFFDGFDLVPPGVVDLPEWQPDSQPADEQAKRWAFGGVGRKPAPPGSGDAGRP